MVLEKDLSCVPKSIDYDTHAKRTVALKPFRNMHPKHYDDDDDDYLRSDINNDCKLTSTHLWLSVYH